MNFAEAMALHRAISILPLSCSEKCPRLVVFDNQNEGFSVKFKKPLAKKCCRGCCVRGFLESYNLRIKEDEKYLTFY